MVALLKGYENFQIRQIARGLEVFLFDINKIVKFSGINRFFMAISEYEDYSDEEIKAVYSFGLQKHG